ncbi:hypothetical protein OS493_024097, partial [Desmophyllum pertusum]
ITAWNCNDSKSHFMDGFWSMPREDCTCLLMVATMSMPRCTSAQSHTRAITEWQSMQTIAFS